MIALVFLSMVGCFSSSTVSAMSRPPAWARKVCFTTEPATYPSSLSISGMRALYCSVPQSPPTTFSSPQILPNLDVFRDTELAIHRGTLHLVRSRFLWRDSCFENISLVNHGLEAVDVPLRIGFDADFTDIFEVRGTIRARRGHRLPHRIEHSAVVLPYEGLDNVLRETRIESNVTPASVSASCMEFELELPPKQHVTIQIEICCSSESARDSVGYDRALSSARFELAETAKFFPQITSSNSRFSDWIARSVSDLQMMIAGNPEKNYPYAGVPWFSTVFGRDGIITALQTLWLNPEMAKGVLEYLAATQADSIDPVADSEPGKILHEMRRSEMAALGEVPFGRYYGSVDSTPLFVMLAGAYFDRTADRSFIEAIWPNVERALKWIDDFGDVDGDGFIEYARHSSKGLVQQGWKDSSDSVFYADGRIADAPIALCEVQGYVYAAKLAAARLARMLGHVPLCLRSRSPGGNFTDAIRESILEQRSRYLRSRPRWPQAPLQRALLPTPGIACSPASCRQTAPVSVADLLMSPDFFTGWGIRTIASNESRYNPLSYHNGSIWPHDNSIIANGLAKYGYKKMAGQILLAMLDLSSEVELRRLPELFCGLKRRSGEGPTLYPVACSPQAWASGTPFFILEGCLGISVHPELGRIVFDRPFLPEGIPQLAIRNLRCGKYTADLLLDRRNEHRLGTPRKSPG